jgi:PIN domain nuclease of toxin-antitoxin system
MKLLIDTQSFIWFFEADDKLPPFVRTMVENVENSLAVGLASFGKVLSSLLYF